MWEGRELLGIELDGRGEVSGYVRSVLGSTLKVYVSYEGLHVSITEYQWCPLNQTRTFKLPTKSPTPVTSQQAKANQPKRKPTYIPPSPPSHTYPSQDPNTLTQPARPLNLSRHPVIHLSPSKTPLHSNQTTARYRVASERDVDSASAVSQPESRYRDGVRGADGLDIKRLEREERKRERHRERKGSERQLRSWLVGMPVDPYRAVP